jgi:TonB family protein
MAFRALLFSRKPETNAALASACINAGVHPEGYSDIFTAIKKATQQRFSCLLADWSDQPDAGFLLKRARESGSNKLIVAIGIVDKNPTEVEIRDHRLDFLIPCPIVPAQAEEILAKAIKRMQAVDDEELASPAEVYTPPRRAVTSAVTAKSPQQDDELGENELTEPTEPSPDEEDAVDGNEIAEFEAPARTHKSPLVKAFAAALVLAAAIGLWSARDSILYLARTPEGGINVLRESLATLYTLPPETVPVQVAHSPAPKEVPAATGDPSTGPEPQIGVVEDATDLKGSHIELRKAPDFPQPAPVNPEPAHTRTAVVPESLRGSAPISPPVVVTTNAAQIMPVSAPSAPPVSTQSLNEPVPVSEATERALLIQSVKPEYPPEAAAQKLHGTVVLQAIIGRDGQVEDLKIVRGYFLLGKAAIAAVKQWHFQPYNVNGHATQTQTVITIDFDNPSS